VGFLKRFNREQLTLGAAGLIGVLLFGWQLTRSSGDGGGGELPRNDRVYSIGSQSQIEFVHAKVTPYTEGRDIWEPPAAGRLPIPEIRPPEPRLGQMTLPPLGPRPDDAEFNKVSLPGKFRWIGSAVQASPPAGFPAEAEIAALKSLAEVDSGGVVDKRKQLMRPPKGDSLFHMVDGKDIEGRIILDSHQTPDGSISIQLQAGSGTTTKTVRLEEIKGGDEGIERGWEYGSEYKRRAGKLKPDDVEGHRKLAAWCRDKAGMLPEARTELKAAVEALGKKGDTGPAMWALVRELKVVLTDLGNYDEAIAAVQDYIETVKGGANDNAQIHLDLGALYADLGYHERSLISYDAAFALEPGRAPGQIALARARLNLGETKLAMARINALFVGGPPSNVDDLARALVVQGLTRLRHGLAQEAEESFAAALAAKPNLAEALNGVGVALALQKKPDAAGKFLAAIKADQYLIDAWLNLAFLYLSEGRPVEAEILFSGAAQRDPDSSTAAAGPGFIAVLTGKYADASAAFDRARKIQPDDYFMSYALGRLKLREGKADEALALFRAALKANPDYLPATTDTALAYLMLAREEQNKAASAPRDEQAQYRDRADGYRTNAQTLLEASYRADPNSVAANVALGCVYAVRGRVRDAISAFDRAVAVRPGVPDPLIDYARGYLDYWHGAPSPKDRLEAAELRFKYGQSHTDLKDPSDLEWQKECGKALDSIENWRVQRVLIEERFDGNQPSLANSWITVIGTGEPQIRFANDRANLGDASGTSQAASFVALEHRDIPRDTFLSVEGTFLYDASPGFEAGFSLYTTALAPAGTATGLHFVFLEDPTASGAKPILIFHQQMMADRTKGPSRPNIRLGALPAAPTRVRFKLERKDHPTEQKTWQFDFSVWDDAKGAWRLLTDKTQIKVPQAVANAPAMMLQLWARTLNTGRKWSVGIDDVRVLTVEKQ